ncbi:MAG: phosphoribosylamine--glycine ligase [Rhodovarius sp.]|nr:phosphoribosylamine--glycine ligase [Rhodovarius sp.]MDW8315811.1 phosphoribosylamine--glycine ligase [Rhodovarius sp.]
MRSISAAPALCLSLLLAGCGIGAEGRAPPAAPLTPEQQACRQEARDSPEVREARRRWAPGVNDRWLLQEVQALEDAAYRACLRARRLPGPSGVEPPR